MKINMERLPGAWKSVLGTDKSTRTHGQQMVVNWLDMQTRSSRFSDSRGHTHSLQEAARIDGMASLAGAILNFLETKEKDEDE